MASRRANRLYNPEFMLAHNIIPEHPNPEYRESQARKLVRANRGHGRYRFPGLIRD
jgi:hypothetical protein